MTEWQVHTAVAMRDQITAMSQRQLPQNRDGFDDEFDALRAVDYKVRCNRDEFYTASLGSNISKNRFRDVLPNEGTRVVLDAVNDRGDGDYINANYVDGRRLFGVPFVYIATQAPLRSTTFDFWRMIFENNSAYVVMLCAEIEAGKMKSEKYWPDEVGETLSFGPLSVTLVNVNPRKETVFRTLLLRAAGSNTERQINHFQFIRWPDQGVPESTTGLMEIVYALGRSPLTTQTPIVVHCSGGVGRTGTFITLHVALALFQLEQPISVPRIVQFLKYCRSGMVQRKDQYLFCYYAILREIERMVWEAQSATQARARMAAGGAQSMSRSASMRSNADGGPRPRQPEHVPRHPAQYRPQVERSSLRAPVETYEGGGGFGGGGSMAPPIRSPVVFESRGVRSPVKSMNTAPYAATSAVRSSGVVMMPSSMFNPTAVPSDLESEVRRLQQANQQARQTPARGREFSQPVPLQQPLQPLSAGISASQSASVEPAAYYNARPPLPSVGGTSVAPLEGGGYRNTRVIDATRMFERDNSVAGIGGNGGDGGMPPAGGNGRADDDDRRFGIDFAASPRAASPPRREDGYPAAPPSSMPPLPGGGGRQLDFHSSPAGRRDEPSAASSVGGAAAASNAVPVSFFERYQTAAADASPRPMPTASSGLFGGGGSRPAPSQYGGSNEPSTAHPASPTTAVGGGGGSDLSRAANDFNSAMFAGGAGGSRRGDVNLL